MRRLMGWVSGRMGAFQSTHRTQTMRLTLPPCGRLSSAFQSTHRTQTMRPTCNIRALITIFISIHASYANDATFVWPGWPPGAQFQSTHRTQTMRRILSWLNLLTVIFQSTHRTQTMRPQIRNKI